MVRPVPSLLLGLAVALCASTRPADASVTVRLCGQKLVNIIKHLCNHKYITPQATYSPGHYSNHKSPPRVGIVESCCWKPCSYAYLKSFCDQSLANADLSTSSSTTTTTATTTVTPSTGLVDDAQSEYDYDIRAAANQQVLSPQMARLHPERSRTFPNRQHQFGSSKNGSVNSDVDRTTGTSPKASPKTFRSLFHLLSYLSQFLSTTATTSSSLSTSEEAISEK